LIVSEFTKVERKVIVMMNLKLDLKINDFARQKMEENIIEEPVSPPACEADEGPPLIFSQSIEDIASEVVDENRMLKKKAKTNAIEFDNIPKVVKLKERNSLTPLIPATVSDISEETLLLPRSSQQPPTLHMSGGMVSTDMTPIISSVPTSVITNNTNTSITVKEDEGLDNILHYFMCEPHTHKDDDHNNIPLDLSLGKVTERSKLLPKTVETSVCQLESKKRKRDENSCKRPVMIQTEVQGSNFRIEKKIFEHESKVKKVKECDIGKQNSSENMQLDELRKGNNYECRLLLPKKKEQSAKIVFPNGLHVDIERSLFINLEKQIFDKRHKIQEKLPLKEKKDSKRRKKAPKKLKKIQDSLPKPLGFQLDLPESPNSTPNIGLCDIKPKDMPLIVIEEDQTDMKGTHGVRESSMTPPPTPPPFSITNVCNPKPKHLSPGDYSPNSVSPPQTPPPSRHSLSTPPPSNPSSPSGLHKLPSIVSKPSYYAKCENRKMMKRS